jgi:hypothetical protein
LTVEALVETVPTGNQGVAAFTFEPIQSALQHYGSHLGSRCYQRGMIRCSQVTVKPKEINH